MSDFRCEKCGMDCYDSPEGYVTGCDHYPPDKLDNVKQAQATVEKLRRDREQPIKFRVDI